MHGLAAFSRKVTLSVGHACMQRALSLVWDRAKQFARPLDHGVGSSSF